MTSYWVYESWPHNKAIIHKGECLYCQNGQNRQGTRSDKDGAWRGPFLHPEKAVTAARATKRKINRHCRHCFG